jgi:hypothetical protein
MEDRANRRVIANSSDGAIRAIDLGHVGLWRGRLRHEGHDIGSQGEWSVPDGYPYKVIAEM